jgi:DNA repair protein RadA/Sms
MSKTRVQWVCQVCGRTSPRPMGRCPGCGEWNTMVEVAEERVTAAAPPVIRSEPQLLGEVRAEGLERFSLPLAEFSRVLGGGLVPGSLVLIGGEPGIGKSTLLLQVSSIVATTLKRPVLYVSGEESARQIKMRADRLGVPHRRPLRPLRDHPGGHPAPRRAPLPGDDGGGLHPDDHFRRPALSRRVGHAGPGGRRPPAVVGPNPAASSSFWWATSPKRAPSPARRSWKHIVDTVLYLEGDPFHTYRLLRTTKNRFGATSEVGVFEMREEGLVEVENPSEVFLAERMVQAPGSAIAVTMEGTRPLLVEVQALTSHTSFGHPRRTANGVDMYRLLLIVAVLTRRVGLRLFDQDVFVNVVGGLQIEEPAADLAVAVAIGSSLRERPVAADLAVIGEVGLSGEVRAVGQMAARLKEAARLGFKRCLVPRTVRRATFSAPEGLELVPVRSVAEALERALV